MEMSEKQAELHRQIEAARDDAMINMVDLAANLIRMIRGGGAYYQLASQLLAAADAFRLHWALSKTWPYNEVQNSIQRIGPSIEDERAYAEEQIILGALQIVASDLLTQRTQRTKGHDQMMKGVRMRRAVVAWPS